MATRPPKNSKSHRGESTRVPRRRGARSRPLRGRQKQAASYPRIRRIDGQHPLKAVAPSAVVDYPARRRRDSRIAYFNFELARQIGILPANHPDRLGAKLRKSLLDAFSLVIVNEWDESHGNVPHPRDLKPHPYMATRYLQLQHPNTIGKNSGDGRSVWNGMIRTPKGTWDVSSCGTGVTRLCPATSEFGEFFRTGNYIANYGCGTAHVEEGLGAALMSESFARNGVATERVLAILSLPSGQAINVRVAPNLLRPSHFFGLLRRRQDEDLRNCVLYYADREIESGRWPRLKTANSKFKYLAERVALDFARATARFESDYIFCWLDWDGDNVLADGSILDYGSVRQFGLYHHHYRFKDDDRYSTTLPEQKRKARQIVQRFAQIRDLLVSGEFTPFREFRDDSTLTNFDREFEVESRRLFLERLGLDEDQSKSLAEKPPKSLLELMTLHRRFEKCRSSRGPHRVPDGLSWNAVYCMRDVLRELPQRLIEVREEGKTRLPADEVLEIGLSAFASRKDRAASAYRKRSASLYQRAYIDLIEKIARNEERDLASLLSRIAPVARARNPYARMTGDGLTHAARQLAAKRASLTADETYRLVEAFASGQDVSIGHGLPPEVASGAQLTGERPLVQRLHACLQRVSQDFRESL